MKRITDHDFSKLSIVPFAYHLHEIPESSDKLITEDYVDEIESGKPLTQGNDIKDRFFTDFRQWWQSL